MKFTVQIESKDAALTDDPIAELSRILKDIEHKIVNQDWYPGHSKTIFDINGNDVGRWKIYPNPHK